MEWIRKPQTMWRKVEWRQFYGKQGKTWLDRLFVGRGNRRVTKFYREPELKCKQLAIYQWPSSEKREYDG